MHEANPHLTSEVASHLTLYGTRMNEDNTYSWKFDNYVHIRSPYQFNLDDAKDIWSRISVPTLLIRGAESWAADPEKEGRTRVIGIIAGRSQSRRPVTGCTMTSSTRSLT